ncbi:uncharacterized protein LOC128884064 isoform X2 [Hylaeus volcanicus]|uniref:uncharacterized protein LOC128884064 isoform X2 n=1 Tax=Hylaeus volcanicus TaxID=313075 RepID=UPI0023B78249|nr:uncharacterized protein LOC128884064 isoform X2 [Hylaeus volcanicus]
MRETTNSISHSCENYLNFLNHLKAERFLYLYTLTTSFVSNTLKALPEAGHSKDLNDSYLKFVSCRLFSFLDTIIIQAKDFIHFLSPNENNAVTKSCDFSSTNCEKLLATRKESSYNLVYLDHFEHLVVSQLLSQIQFLFLDEQEKDVKLHCKLTWMNAWIQTQHLEIRDDFAHFLEKSAPWSGDSCKTLQDWISAQFSFLDSFDTCTELMIVICLVQYAGDKMNVLLKIISCVVKLLNIQEKHERSENDASFQQGEEELLGQFYERDLKNRGRKTNKCDSINTVFFNSAYDVNADILLEALVWMIIKIAPHSLFLNLGIIQYCRHPQLFSSEQLYYLTMLASAAEFLLTLKASKDLYISDSFSRSKCLSYCPEEYVNDWIGNSWGANIDESLQQCLDPSSTFNGSTQSTLLTTCKPLPSSFQVSANYFTQHTYNIFQKGLADACGEKAYRKLYFDRVSRISFPLIIFLKKNNSTLEKLPALFQPSIIHQTISLCVRILMKDNASLFDSLFETNEKTKQFFSYYKCDTFKKKIFTIYLMTESYERLIFTQIFQQLFPYILYFTEYTIKPKSFLQVLAYESFGPFHLLEKADTLTRRLFHNSFLQSSNLKDVNELPDTTSFSKAVSSIKNYFATLIIFDLIHPTQDQHKRLLIVFRRLTHLSDYTNPFEKIKTFVALLRLSESLKRTCLPSASVYGAAAIASIFIIYANPKFLTTHLIYSTLYRHPLLLCSEINDALDFMWFVCVCVCVCVCVSIPRQISVIETFSAKVHTMSIEASSVLLHLLHVEETLSEKSNTIL